jgi:O-antigen ligase
VIQNRALDKLRTLIVSDDPKLAFLGILIVCLGAGLLVGALFGGLGPIIALALMAVVCAGYLVMRSTEWGLIGLLGVIILLPYATLPFKIVFTPTFIDVIMAAIFGVWFLRLITGKETVFIGSALAMPIFAFLAWAVVTFVFGLGHAPLTPYVLRNFAEVILAVCLFFVALNQVRTAATLKHISIIILLAGGLMAMLGIFFYIIPELWAIRLLSMLRVVGYPTEGILHYIEDNPANPMRAISTSIDPNALGGLLIILTVIGVAHLFARGPIMPRPYLMIIVGSMALALYLTFSRGSLLGVVAALLAMSLLRYRKLFIYMVGVALLVLILPQTQSYVSRFIEGLQGADLATQMRFGEYKDALMLISRYPLMGVGFSGTPDIDLYIGVSNLYFLIAEQMGLIGLALFILVNLVFFVLIYHTWRQLPAGHHLEAPLLGYSLAVFGAMVGGVFDHFFFNIQFTHLVALYWLAMGLAVTTAHKFTFPEASKRLQPDEATKSWDALVKK